MIKYPQEKIGIKGNSLTLIKDLNPKYTENITLKRIRTQVAILGSLLFYRIISRPTRV